MCRYFCCSLFLEGCFSNERLTRVFLGVALYCFYFYLFKVWSKSKSMTILSLNKDSRYIIGIVFG